MLEARVGLGLNLSPLGELRGKLRDDGGVGEKSLMGLGERAGLPIVDASLVH